nr:unnamed protein product [Callosobruchus chinensis]
MNWKSTLLNLLPKKLEICGIQLTYKQKVHIFYLYRKPSSDFKIFIEVFSSFLEYNYKSKRTKDVILINSLEKNLLQDTMSSFGFQNILGESTRVSQKSATTIAMYV